MLTGPVTKVQGRKNRESLTRLAQRLNGSNGFLVKVARGIGVRIPQGFTLYCSRKILRLAVSSAGAPRLAQDDTS